MNETVAKVKDRQRDAAETEDVKRATELARTCFGSDDDSDWSDLEGDFPRLIRHQQGSHVIAAAILHFCYFQAIKIRTSQTTEKKFTKH